MSQHHQDRPPDSAGQEPEPDRLPGFLDGVIARYPAVWRAYQQLGRAAAGAGPLDARTQRLVKLALAVGAQAEGAVHSHARRALREGIAAAELHQVALLAVTSIGWSAAMAALSWIRDVTETGQPDRPTRPTRDPSG